MASKFASLTQSVVRPVVNMAHRIETKSASKISKADANVLSMIQAHEAAGTDAAHATTRQFLRAQRFLMHYRVVRFFDELRFLSTGAYFKGYGMKNFVVDARFFTQALFLFIIFTLIGRTSIFPPIAPDSPLVLGLTTKVNPNY